MRLCQPTRDTARSKVYWGLVSVMGLLLSASPLQSQGIITTIAGNGSPAFAGDGGLATAAALNHPWGLAIDSAGAIYIADTDNGRIRRVSPGGMISTVAGDGLPGASGDGGSALSASLSDVAGVALDAAGNVYFGDASNRRVRKVTPAGIISTVAGTGMPGFSGDGGPATNATLNRPTFVVVDPAGKLYITDSSNQRIRRVDLNGTITTIAGNGLAGFSGDGGPATDASLMFPLGITMDRIGNLYVADANNHRIRRIDLRGVITTVAGNGAEGFSGDLGPATSASLNYPEDVAVDGSGNLFIADCGNNRIRKVDASGVISTIAGTILNGFSGDGGPSVVSVLNFPWGLASDPAGGVYIADRVNNRIRKISSGRSATITTVVSGASFLPGFSASSWITIQGANLSQTTRTWQNSDFVNDNLPTQLDGVSVNVNGKAGFVYYISPAQLNVLAPDDAINGQVQVQVTNAHGTSSNFAANETQFSPAFFLFAAKYPAAVHTSGVGVGPKGLIAGTNFAPAKPGETILLFGTGFGPTNPALPGGQLVTGAAPLVTQPTVTIGGKPAQVLFAGLSGSGLDQFNVTIPPDLPNGDASVVAAIAGATTQPNIFITIQR